MKTLHIATYNRTSEIFDSREEAEAFAAEMNDDSHPFNTTIREIDFEEAFELCEKAASPTLEKSGTATTPTRRTNEPGGNEALDQQTRKWNLKY